jgi:hypothetical protein
VTDTATQDKLLDKVRKLLAKAEDPAVTEPEAEAYNERAAALIAQYGIDRALLAAAGKVADDITSVRLSVDNPYSRDKADLLNSVCTALRGRTIYHSRGKTVYGVTIFGFQSDLERVQLLYTSLLLQASTQLARVRPDGYYESVAAYRRSWLAGFRNSVYHRLIAAERRAGAEAAERAPMGTSTAIVLVDRSARVEAAFKESTEGMSELGNRRLSGSGRRDGYRAGQTADLGATRIDASRHAITG